MLQMFLILYISLIPFIFGLGLPKISPRVSLSSRYPSLRTVRAIPSQISHRNSHQIQSSSFDELGVQVYDSQLWFANFVENNLGSVSPISFGLLYAGGLLTAFSPCVLGLLPITLAYLGIELNSNQNESPVNDLAGTSDTTDRLLKVLSYSVGMTTLFCLFGISAAFLGQAFNPSSTIGAILGLAVSSLTIFMGLNLLELVEFSFPDLSNLFDSSSNDEESTSSSNSFSPTKSIVQPFLFGASSALIASPCSSPVLASLIAVIGASGRPALGASFLFAYSLGYVTPVMIAGLLSGSITKLLSSGKDTSWVNELFASVLITFGTYKALENISLFFI